MRKAKLELTNEDNMELMARYPDGYFELAIVDPEYGIGISSNPIRQKHTKKDWDNSIPLEKYFLELKRVSKHQVIWGGNYFIDYLNNTQCFLIWDKKQPFDFSLAMCEMAWTSFSKPAKIFTQSVLKERGKIHPTQKPIELYKWLLTHYAEKGDKILDTHLGSMSIAIACHDYGFDLVGCELDKEYYDQGMARIKKHTNQLNLFIE
jgi:site-specific DNA-methyltransferase (adenine-specific)